MLVSWSNVGMDIHEHRRRRLSALIDSDKAAPGNVAAFARKHNQDAARLRQVLNASYREGQSFGERVARRLEKDLGLPPMYFDLGFAPQEHKTSASDTSMTGQNPALIKRLLPEGQGNVLTWERPEDLEDDGDRVWIDRYDYRFSAGSGLMQWEVRQKKALPFEVGFFKALGVRPQDCRLAQVHGRSMEPYLFHRDMMMICTSKAQIKDGHIYAVYFEDEQLVKQIFKEPNGALRLHSYNPEFPDRVLIGDQLEALHVAGEVIYRSGSGLAGGN